MHAEKDKKDDVTYSLRIAKTIRLAFKFCLTKTVCLDCSKVHIINVILSTTKK